MSNLSQLIAKCKSSVHLDINEHTSVYQTVEDLMNEVWNVEFIPEIPKEVFDKMIETNTVVKLQFYPNSANSFYRLYHYDVDMVIDQALKMLE